MLAKLGDEKITAGEVDKAIAGQLASANREARDKKYNARADYLRGKLMEKVLKAEAAKRGVPVEELVKTEVEKAVPNPPDDQMKQVFDQAQAAGKLPPNVTFEQVKPQIAQFLTQAPREKAIEDLFKKLLKEQNGALYLSEPRVQVEATGPSKGPASAPVTIVEFSDFQCPYCGMATKELHQVMGQYGDKVRLVFRNFPLDFHKQAQKAAEAGLCAQEQGKFWEMHDKMFENQRELEVEKLKEYAKGLGLDAAKFDQCLDSGKMAEQIKKDQAAGEALGVTGTPAFVINGIFRGGALQAEQFKQLIDDELARK